MRSEIVFLTNFCASAIAPRFSIATGSCHRLQSPPRRQSPLLVASPRQHLTTPYPHSTWISTAAYPACPLPSFSAPDTGLQYMRIPCHWGT